MPHAPSRLKYSIVFSRVFLKPATSELWTDSLHYYINNVRWPIFFKESAWFLFFSSLSDQQGERRSIEDQVRLWYIQFIHHGTKKLMIIVLQCLVLVLFCFLRKMSCSVYPWISQFIHDQRLGLIQGNNNMLSPKKIYSSSSPNECSNK